MTVAVLVRREPRGGYRATVLGWRECTASAPSREEAIERTRQSLVDLLAEAESPEELKRYAGGLPSV